MMKKLITTLLCVCMTLTCLQGCGKKADAPAPSAEAPASPAASSSKDGESPSSETPAESLALKLGTCAPESSTFVGNSQIFADKLAELSNGGIKVEIVGGGALGNVPQHFAQLNDGTLDIFVQGVDAPAAVKGGEDFGILNVPFLFDDVEHFHDFLKSDVFSSMMKKVEEGNNFSFLGLLGDRPARSLSTKNKEVREPADMKGLVFRVPESAVPVAVFKAWGANTTTCAPGAIFEGLQSGQFDGQDNGIETMVLDGFMEVQGCYMDFDHTYQGIGAFISDKTKEKLSEEQFAWVEESLQYAFESTSAKIWNEEVPSYYKAMEEKSVTVVKDVNKDAFRAVVETLIPEFEGKYFSKGLYDQIRALK